MKKIELIFNKIKEIDLLLNKTVSDYSLMGEAGGVMLFKAHYMEYCNNNKIYISETTFLSDYIENVIELTNNDTSCTLTFCDGLVGLGWLLVFLGKKDWIDISKDLLDELETKTIESGNFFLRELNFDFLHGIAGNIFYISENDFHSEAINDFLNIFFESFGQNVIEKKDSSYLLYYNDIEKNERINLSLSHGLSSLIVIFSKLLKIRNDKLTVNYVEKFINFLKKSKRDTHNIIGLYPHYIDEDIKKNIHYSRLAWCYGDLGIGIAFWQAGKALNREDWKQEAIDIFYIVAKDEI